MINEIRQDRPGHAQYLPVPSVVVSGMPLLYGTKACVALDSYDSGTGCCTVRFSGDFALTVVGASTQSPVSGEQINPGDELYASGTLDATTGITYNLTIDKTRGNCPFGNYVGESPILEGATNTSAAVALKEGGSPGPYGA